MSALLALCRRHPEWAIENISIFFIWTKIFAYEAEGPIGAGLYASR